MRHSVNFPAVSLEPSGGYRLAITNRNVPGMLSQIMSVLAARQINVVDMINKSREGVAYNLIDIAEEAEPALIDAICGIDSVMNVREFQIP